MKIVSSVLPKDHLREQLIREFPQAEFFFYKGMEEAAKDIVDAEIFITYGNDLSPDIIVQAKRLKWIMVMSAGVEEMPLQACVDKGIIVTNARGIHKIPMAEYTIGMMLQHEKKTKQLWKNEQAEIWDRKLSFGELNKKTVLMLGTGSIGQEIARLAKAFHMNAIGMNRSGRSVPFFDQTIRINELEANLPQADYIVSILPSTRETIHLLKEKHFKLMKRSAVFCNIGRGDVVEERVLLQALRQNDVAHAFLDVFADEPLRERHPFWQMDEVTVTPHISSITKHYVERAFIVFTHNLHAYGNKEEWMNIVDIKKGY